MSNQAHPIKIFLFNRFEIVSGEKCLTADQWTRRKAATLLQRLALERRLIKDQVIDFLWPEASLASGSNNLYRTLYALRQTLEEYLGMTQAEQLFTFNDGVLALTESVWVDVYEFERLITSHPSVNGNKEHNLQTAVDLYQGVLLPDDVYSDWLSHHRERLYRLYREACLTLADTYEKQGDYGRSLTLLTPLLTHDPVDEPIHRELIRLYALNGRRHEAMRQYQTCIEVLDEELGVPPEPETRALYEQLLRGELEAPKSPPKSKTPAGISPAPLAVESQRTLPFTGRDLELETIQRQINLTWQGQGHTILLAGPTGVGKTRLAYETLQTAVTNGITPLYGAFYEQEGQLPYQPFIEAFNRYLQAQSRPLSQNPITHHKLPDVTDTQQEHWALFNATVAFLADLAEQTPVILLIDDLHAADETSLRLFHFLARQTRNLPIILLATYRTDIATNLTSPFGTLLNSLYRERLQTVIHVTSLTQDRAAAFMAHLFHGEPAPTLVEAMLSVTDGNPFFMEETAQNLLKQEQVIFMEGQWRLKPGITLRIPTGLHGLMQERVAQLGETAVNTLQAAAVTGREFSFDILRRITTLSEYDLFDALDTALAAHLLEESSNGYRFRHGFIRHVLYEGQNRARRARQHTLVAQAIVAAYSHHPDGLTPHVETLAYHYRHSDQRHEALPYLLQSGHKAAQLHALEVAVHYFEQALILMDEFGVADSAMRWQILEGLGTFSVVLADTKRAVHSFEMALALPTTDTWQPQSYDRVRIHRLTATAFITAGNTAAAETHLNTALALINEEENAEDFAHLLYTLALLHWHRNEHQDAFDIAQRSLTIAERLNNPTAVARAFEMLALACHSTGDWQLGLLYEEQRSNMAGSSALDVTEAFDLHL